MRGAARLGYGDDVWNFLAVMATNGVFHTGLAPSHYDHLNVFNVDASWGIPSVINNCLLISLPGVFDLLPALLSAWQSGSISGILARGQIKVDRLAWDVADGRVTANLTSARKQSVQLGVPP